MRLALVLPVAGSLVLVVVQDCSGETLRQATTPTQTQRVTWVRQFNEPDLELRGVEADSSGIYVTGWTEGALVGQTGFGGTDVFIRRYDANGVEGWTRQFGTPADDKAVGVAVAPGAIYAASAEAEGYTAMLKRYDGDGNARWSRRLPWQPTGVTATAEGVYVVGVEERDGRSRGYILKYDSDGARAWVKTYWNGRFGWSSGVASDETGVYVVTQNVGLRKYTSDGSRLWFTRFETGPLGVLVAATAGNAYVGWTDDGYQSLVRKYRADGASVWTRRFGTDRYDALNGLAADAEGVYAGGETHGTFANQMYFGGRSDVFVRAYDSSGTRRWTVQLGTGKADYADDVASNSGAIFMVGFTFGSFEGTAGSETGFVARVA